MTSIGVVGLGYWGPNLARNFDRLPGCELAWLCDASEGALERFGAGFPGVRTTSSVTDLLDDDTLDAIVLATPVPTHADMARQVLDAGKHCFVEKPLVGSKRMATFDDMELERKLTVYDKGFDEKYESYGEYIARSGDIFSPRVANEEPLRIECRHFLECVATGAAPRSDGEAGLRVVRVLETLQQSLQESTRAAPV